MNTLDICPEVRVRGRTLLQKMIENLAYAFCHNIIDVRLEPETSEEMQGERPNCFTKLSTCAEA